jgi:uncharacterized protein YdeI (BOF family)
MLSTPLVSARKPQERTYINVHCRIVRNYAKNTFSFTNATYSSQITIAENDYHCMPANSKYLKL